MKLLTAKDLERIYKKLMECRVPTFTDEKGCPCYQLHIHGTKEEIAETQRLINQDDS